MYKFLKLFSDELLVINDEFNNVFEKYERYMANRSSEPTTAATSVLEHDGRPLSEQLSSLQIHGATSKRDTEKYVCIF